MIREILSSGFAWGSAFVLALWVAAFVVSVGAFAVFVKSDEVRR